MKTSALYGLAPEATEDRVLIIGRTFIAGLFVISGLVKAVSFGDTAAWMAASGIPVAPVVLAAVLVLEIGGGLALAAGWHARAVAALLALFTVATTVTFHAFWAVPADQAADQLTHALKNLAIVGGLLLVSRQSAS